MQSTEKRAYRFMGFSCVSWFWFSSCNQRSCGTGLGALESTFFETLCQSFPEGNRYADTVAPPLEGEAVVFVPLFSEPDASPAFDAFRRFIQDMRVFKNSLIASALLHPVAMPRGAVLMGVGPEQARVLFTAVTVQAARRLACSFFACKTIFIFPGRVDSR